MPEDILVASQFAYIDSSLGRRSLILECTTLHLFSLYDVTYWDVAAEETFFSSP